MAIWCTNTRSVQEKLDDLDTGTIVPYTGFVAIALIKAWGNINPEEMRMRDHVTCKQDRTGGGLGIGVIVLVHQDITKR